MIVLIGESGSGKSTVERCLVKKGFKRAISHTTRPIRVGEVDGVDYFFVSKNEIEKMYSEGRFAEYIPYLDNIYALTVGECQNDKVVVVEPKGLTQLEEKDYLELFVVYLYTSEEVRRKRMLSRGDNPKDVSERILKDRDVFAKIGLRATTIIDADDYTVDQLADIVIDRYNNR